MRRLRALLLSISFHYPRTLLSIAIALALAGAYVYLAKLPITTSRTQLTSQDFDFNRRYRAFEAEFGDVDNVLILAVRLDSAAGANGNAADVSRHALRRAMKQVARQWAASLREQPELFPAVYERIDWAEFDSLALLYAPLPVLQQSAETFEWLRPRLAAWAGSPSLETLFAQLNQSFDQIDSLRQQEAILAAAIDGLGEGIGWIRQALNREPADSTVVFSLHALIDELGSGRFDPDGYFFSQDGDILTAFARVRGDASQRNRYGQVMAAAEHAREQAMASLPPAYPVNSGLAGMPALEAEEMATTERDFTRGALLTLVLVSLLFVWGFGNLIRPALAAFCLLLTIGMTFVLAWLLVGHLNMLAMIFAVVLVALGIDFAIHITTHYEHALGAGYSPERAIRKTYSAVGGALWLGGVTTAAAFLSAAFTDFVGLAELGIIAGGGLLVCLLCMFFVYPAGLYLLDSSSLRLGQRLHFRTGFRLQRWAAPARLQGSAAGKLLLFAILAVAVFGYLFGQFHFDTNLLNLQAIDGRASTWQRLLLATDDRTQFAIATYDTRQALEEVRREFEARTELVERTESLFPAGEMEKRRLLQRIRESLAGIEVAEGGASSAIEVRRQLFRFRHTLRSFRRSSRDAHEALQVLDSEIDALYRLLSSLPPETAEARLRQLDERLRLGTLEALDVLHRLTDPPPVTPERLPASFRERFLGDRGTLALYIYPEANTWYPDHLNAFVEQAREVEPRLFGGAVNFYENGRAIIRSFLQAAFYSLITIIVLILLWTRSLRETLLTLLPLLAGTGWLLLAMKWWPGGLHWNFANFFALPILIGIGVDSGIHLVRGWRDPDAETFTGAVKAVLLSALTTIIGFGILSTSNHLGVGSLGLVLFLGISFMLIISLTVLPAALQIALPRNKNKVENADA